MILEHGQTEISPSFLDLISRFHSKFRHWIPFQRLRWPLRWPWRRRRRDSPSCGRAAAHRRRRRISGLWQWRAPGTSPCCPRFPKIDGGFPKKGTPKWTVYNGQYLCKWMMTGNLHDSKLGDPWPLDDKLGYPYWKPQTDDGKWSMANRKLQPVEVTYHWTKKTTSVWAQNSGNIWEYRPYIVWLVWCQVVGYVKLCMLWWYNVHNLCIIWLAASTVSTHQSVGRIILPKDHITCIYIYIYIYIYIRIYVYIYIYIYIYIHIYIYYIILYYLALWSTRNEWFHILKTQKYVGPRGTFGTPMHSPVDGWVAEEN